MATNRAPGDPAGDDARRASTPVEQASPTEPIRIDWIEPALLADGRPGRLGMTHLPGKHGISSRYPGLEYRRDLHADLVRLRALGVGTLLLLVEDHELARWGDTRIVERAAEEGIVVRRHSIRDGGVVDRPATMALLLAELRAARSGSDAAVACMGGVGRTGLVASCALVEAGLTAAEAIRAVRQLRHPDAVETDVQRRFVEAYAAWLSRRPRDSAEAAEVVD